jgi:hypothetical protein
MIEILELYPIDNKEAISFHVKELCEANNSKNTIIFYNSILNPSQLPKLEFY